MVRYQVESILRREAMSQLEHDPDSYTRDVRKLARSITWHGTFKTRLIGSKKTECMVVEVSSIYPYRTKCIGSEPEKVSELHTIYRFHSPEAACHFLIQLESDILKPHLSGDGEGIEHIIKRVEGKRLVMLTDEEKDSMARCLSYFGVDS